MRMIEKQSTMSAQTLPLPSELMHESVLRGSFTYYQQYIMVHITRNGSGNYNTKENPKPNIGKKMLVSSSLIL